MAWPPRVFQQYPFCNTCTSSVFGPRLCGYDNYRQGHASEADVLYQGDFSLHPRDTGFRLLAPSCNGYPRKARGVSTFYRMKPPLG